MNLKNGQTMENKQTAVEWLIEQLEQKGDASVNVSIGRMQISIKEEEYIDLINQAKAMEKELIKDAFEDGCIGEMYELNAHYSSEKYYNNFYNVKYN